MSIHYTGDEGENTMAAKHSTISEYNPSQESWPEYIESLELYFVANGIEDAVKKQAILLNVCGPDLAQNLTAPAKPSELEYATLVELIQGHVVVAPNLHSRGNNRGKK